LEPPHALRVLISGARRHDAARFSGIAEAGFFGLRIIEKIVGVILICDYALVLGKTRWCRTTIRQSIPVEFEAAAAANIPAGIISSDDIMSPRAAPARCPSASPKSPCRRPSWAAGLLPSWTP